MSIITQISQKKRLATIEEAVVRQGFILSLLDTYLLILEKTLTDKGVITKEELEAVRKQALEHMKAAPKTGVESIELVEEKPTNKIVLG